MFCKTGPAKYISHLDLQRAWSRALRRAGLPVKLSQGFNPHYVMSFASALALGVASTAECVEVTMTEDIVPQDFLQRLGAVMPPGLSAVRAVRLRDDAPHLMAAVREAAYRVDFVHADGEKIKSAVYDIINRKELIAAKDTRGEKKADIRPMILSLKADGDAVAMRLMAGSQGSLRPDIVAREMQKRAADPAYRIERTGLFAHIDGQPVDLLTACT